MSEEFWKRSWKTIEPERIADYAAGFDMSKDAVTDFLHMQGAEKICDAGCGCGIYALKLARSGFSVSGFDISEEAVRLSKYLLSDNGYPAYFRQADVLSTGYPPGTFDAVVARDVVDHMPLGQGVAALRELLRVVRSGGCVLLTLDETDGEYESEPHETTADGDYLYISGKWEGMAFHPYSEQDIKKLAGGAEYRILQSDGHGFTVVIEKG